MSMIKKAAAVSAVAITAIVMLHSSSALACACGCGVFNVGTNTNYPQGSGGTVSFEYDFMNQNRNWGGSSSASSTDNADKRIRTDFYTVGGQYMFNREWGVQVKVPYESRSFDTDVGGGDVEAFEHRAMGDVRVQGVYTGFSADMSTGLEFGLKLPTGDYTYDNFDRDTEIGTGSTDALLGIYHMTRFDPHSPYTWFLHGSVDAPFLTRGGYRPGTEFAAAGGVDHDPVSIGGGVKVAPVMQVINAYRNVDSGTAADSQGSGYERVLVSPGLEFSYNAAKLYTDVSVPVYQHVNGDQLVAPVQFQAVVSYDF